MGPRPSACCGVSSWKIAALRPSRAASLMKRMTLMMERLAHKGAVGRIFFRGRPRSWPLLAVRIRLLRRGGAGLGQRRQAQRHDGQSGGEVALAVEPAID